MTRAAAIVLALVLLPGLAAAAGGGLPGARSIKVCAAAGPYWPTMILAVQGGYAWVACKEQFRVVRVSTSTGKATKSVRLGAQAIAVRHGFGSVWALDAGGTLYRLDPRTGKVAKRISVNAAAAYNIWTGGGSVWVAADQGSEVVRVSPQRNRVLAHIPAGDGPASMAFAGGTAWVVNHRDTTITRIDLASNKSTRLVRLGGDGAPERMIWLRGSLWITGRGTDLLQVNPADGSVRRTIEIGGSGIDLVAEGDYMWVPTRSAEVDPSGFPTMDALKRVSVSSGAVSTVVRSSGRLDVHGLAVAGGAVWIADNRAGMLYRVGRS
jgi:DNA-binding beta-propeller fold protein YncE